MPAGERHRQEQAAAPAGQVAAASVAEQHAGVPGQRHRQRAERRERPGRPPPRPRPRRPRAPHRRAQQRIEVPAEPRGSSPDAAAIISAGGEPLLGAGRRPRRSTTRRPRRPATTAPSSRSATRPTTRRPNRAMPSPTRATDRYSPVCRLGGTESSARRTASCAAPQDGQRPGGGRRGDPVQHQEDDREDGAR